MKLDPIVALAGANSSDAITEMLGIAAIVAFVGVVAYIIVLQMIETEKKRARESSRFVAESSFPSEPKTLSDFDEDFSKEVKKLENELHQFHEESLLKLERGLEDFTKLARQSMEVIAESYADNCSSPPGESRENRIERFKTVCAKQWAFFKAEFRYITFSEVEKNLRQILETSRMIDVASVEEENSNPEEMEFCSDMLRSQDIVSLVRPIKNERVNKLQHEMLTALAPFKEYYEKSVRDSLNDRLFKLIAKLKTQSGKGATISDTSLEADFKRLKHALEIAARLSDRITIHTQKIGEEGIALSQIVYVGTVLDILSDIRNWFPSVEKKSKSVAVR